MPDMKRTFEHRDNAGSVIQTVSGTYMTTKNDLVEVYAPTEGPFTSHLAAVYRLAPGQSVVISE